MELCQEPRSEMKQYNRRCSYHPYPQGFWSSCNNRVVGVGRDQCIYFCYFTLSFCFPCV